MPIKVSDLMTRDVIIATPYDTVSDLRETMLDEQVHGIPIVDAMDVPLGILTSTDLLKDVDPESFACEAMTPGPVFKVAENSDIREAADIMLENNLHHVLITKGKEIVGMLSSFDFLRLMEEKHFTVTNAQTEPKKEKEKTS